jgi:hypothetical protein
VVTVVMVGAQGAGCALLWLLVGDAGSPQAAGGERQVGGGGEGETVMMGASSSWAHSGEVKGECIVR